MIFKTNGTNSKPNTKQKSWWIKLAIAILLSNLFFFFLFSTSETESKEPAVPAGWVELQIRADLLTPFQSGKKVLVLHRLARKKIEAVLEVSPEAEGKFTVLVREEDAPELLKHENWEIVPFLKTLTFARPPKGDGHEIRY